MSEKQKKREERRIVKIPNKKKDTQKHQKRRVTAQRVQELKVGRKERRKEKKKEEKKERKKKRKKERRKERKKKRKKETNKITIINFLVGFFSVPPKLLFNDYWFANSGCT